MFTGIIEEVGTIEAIEPAGSGARLRLAAPLIASDLKEGDSVSVNGVCLTAVALRPGSFGADASPETLRRSTLGKIRPGGQVNLERALLPTTRMGGHIVQGHVDGLGRIQAIDDVGSANWWLTVGYPPELSRYLVFKGSIAINGISLTIAEVNDASFSVAVIPHTWQATTLSHLRPGDEVNLETDILAKYVEKMLQSIDAKPAGLTLEKLIDHGY